MGFWLALPQAAFGRDTGEVEAWLTSYLFEGNGATLVLTKDGFFGLRLAFDRKEHSYLTGLWRLNSDGIELVLYNSQDAEIKLAIGEAALYAILPQLGDVTLIPVQTRFAPFQVIGPVMREGGAASITDANSGKQFVVDAKNAAEGKFATAEVEIGPSGTKRGKVLAHSGAVPRFFRLPLATQGSEAFLTSVVNRYWLVPAMKGIQAAALRFAPPKIPDTKILLGTFEITGPGLRLDGDYSLEGDKLTLQANRASVRRLVLMGAESLVQAFIGDLRWRLSPSGLRLDGKQRLLLLAADS